ncbi:MAG: efflux RND transporter periplasmic adaptor subunit, partial [Gemmataceae bacterium]|nr:efflux RND transporter periplasmic adaptor subunit [Gemmataceae bacterium]
EAEAAQFSADAAIESARAGVAAAEASIATARAAVDSARLDLSYTRITAPFDGVVTSRAVHPGHFVQPGVVLFTVARVDRLRVTVDVAEAAAARAAPGAAAVVRVPALNNREFTEGLTVTRTSGVIQPDTRTLRTEIEIDNADGALKPGMYAFVTIKAAAAEATVLPAACVMTADETQYVYLVEEGKAVKYRVRVGRTDAGLTQVHDRRKATATAGNWVPFGGTEAVVVGNLGALADGAAVEVQSGGQ